MPDVGSCFAPVFALLESAIAQRDFESRAITEAIDRGAAAARAAGVPPERVLSELRAHLQRAPLIAAGDRYRGVLVDRLVLRALEVYFRAARGSTRAWEPNDR